MEQSRMREPEIIGARQEWRHLEGACVRTRTSCGVTTEDCQQTILTISSACTMVSGHWLLAGVRVRRPDYLPKLKKMHSRFRREAHMRSFLMQSLIWLFVGCVVATQTAAQATQQPTSN